MALQFNDGKITGASGVATAGLTLGIIGTPLNLFNNGGSGLFGNWFGNNSTPVNDTEYQAGLQSQIDQLQAEKYSDNKYLDLYTKLVASSEAADAKLNSVASGMAMAIANIDKQSALNEQAARLNREFDNASRDYMFTIVNNKIDCCCEKAAMQSSFDRQISELTDAAILSYVNSSFLPGVLKLPAANISPNVQLA